MPFSSVQIDVSSSENQTLFSVTLIPEVVAEEAMPHSYTYKVELREPELLFYNLFAKEQKPWAELEDDAKASLPQYKRTLQETGSELYNKFFGQSVTVWNKIMEEGEGSYNFNITPLLWKLPWEILHHNKLKYLDRTARPVVRCIGDPANGKKTIHLRTPTLYFVGCEPYSRATHAQEQYDILKQVIPNDADKDRLLRQDKPDPINEMPQWERVRRDLRARPPDILHIVAHGIISDDEYSISGLVFEGKSRYEERTIGYDTLVDLLLEIKQVKLLIISACQSGIFFEQYPQLTRQLFAQTELKAAVVMASDISVEAMLAVTQHFYEALWRRLTVAQAVAAARSALRAPTSEIISLQWSVPMIYESSPLDPFGKFLEKLREYSDFLPLELEYLDEAYSEARNIQKQVERLADLRQQIRPASSSEILLKGQIKASLNQFEKAMAMFKHKRYAPEDQALLHSVQIITSRAFP